MIHQICAYADPNRDYVSAVVHPFPEQINEWANQFGIKGTFAELCKRREIVKLASDELTRVSALITVLSPC